MVQVAFNRIRRRSIVLTLWLMDMTTGICQRMTRSTMYSIPTERRLVVLIQLGHCHTIRQQKRRRIVFSVSILMVVFVDGDISMTPTSVCAACGRIRVKH